MSVKLMPNEDDSGSTCHRRFL